MLIWSFQVLQTGAIFLLDLDIIFPVYQVEQWPISDILPILFVFPHVNGFVCSWLICWRCFCWNPRFDSFPPLVIYFINSISTMNFKDFFIGVIFEFSFHFYV